MMNALASPTWLALAPLQLRRCDSRVQEEQEQDSKNLKRCCLTYRQLYETRIGIAQERGEDAVHELLLLSTAAANRAPKAH